MFCKNLTEFYQISLKNLPYLTDFSSQLIACMLMSIHSPAAGERGGSVVECRTPEREVRGSRPTAAVLCPWARHFTPRKYWLITQEAMAPSRYDWKIVDWDVKPQHNQITSGISLMYSLNSCGRGGTYLWHIHSPAVAKDGHIPDVFTHQLWLRKDISLTSSLTSCGRGGIYLWHIHSPAVAEKGHRASTIFQILEVLNFLPLKFGGSTENFRKFYFATRFYRNSLICSLLCLCIFFHIFNRTFISLLWLWLSWVSSLFCFNYMYYDCGFPGHLHYFIVSCIYYVCGSPGHHHYFIFMSTICSVVVLS